MPRTRIAAAALCCVAFLAGCRRREPPEAARARASARFLESQIQSLEKLVAKAEKGELETSEQIAISISETVVKRLLDASLPQEISLGERARLRLETAQALFRGNKGALLLRARLSSTAAPNTFATVELGGTLQQFEFSKGKLVARAEVAHFSVLEASAGDLAADVIENLVKQNIERIHGVIPPLVIPVSLEESVRIGGLSEGPVVAKPGQLPLAIKVAHVIPANERLWVLLDAQAGKWEPLAGEAKP
jgi:hypothetical protein